VWKEYAGGYSDWQRASQASSVKAISENSTLPDRTAKPAPRATSKSRLSYKENRELEGLPGKISALEGEQGAISTLLGDPLLYRDEPERVRTARQRFTEIEQELTDALVRWEQLSAKQ
jgi:ATP-binding cassette subfamily F protein uup